jgi:hypothetical protein
MNSSKRRWLRFSLRTGILLVTVVSAILAVAARRVHRIAAQQRAIQFILSYHGDVDLEAPPDEPPSGPSSDPAGLLGLPAWKLALTGCPRAYRAWLLVDEDQVHVLRELVALDELRELALAGGLGDEPALELRGLRSLEELHVDAPGSLSAAMIDKMLPPRLKKLDLHGVDLGPLEHLEPVWPNGLAEINLLGCTRLTGRGLGKLMHPALEQLCVDGTELTNAAVAEREAPSSLRTLYIRDASRLSAVGLNRLLGRNVADLRLDAPSLTDDDVEALRWPAGLRQLNLSGCDQLTNRSVAVIAQHCGALERLTLWSPKIDGRCLQSLEALPACTLDLRHTSIPHSALADLAATRPDRSSIICDDGEFHGARFLDREQVKQELTR